VKIWWGTVFVIGMRLESVVSAAEGDVAARRDSTVLAAVSGGGVVSPEYNGFTVRTPDRNCVRWTKTHDGYTAIINRRTTRISRE
jgi:hypothetical protein